MSSDLNSHSTEDDSLSDGAFPVANRMDVYDSSHRRLDHVEAQLERLAALIRARNAALPPSQPTSPTLPIIATSPAVESQAPPPRRAPLTPLPRRSLPTVLPQTMRPSLQVTHRQTRASKHHQLERQRRGFSNNQRRSTQRIRVLRIRLVVRRK